MTGILTSSPGSFNQTQLDVAERARGFPLGVCIRCYSYRTIVESKQAETHLPKANLLLNSDQNSLRRFQRTAEHCQGQKAQPEGLAVVQMAHGVLQSLPAPPMEPAQAAEFQEQRGDPVTNTPLPRFELFFSFPFQDMKKLRAIKKSR